MLDKKQQRKEIKLCRNKKNPLFRAALQSHQDLTCSLSTPTSPAPSQGAKERRWGKRKIVGFF